MVSPLRHETFIFELPSGLCFAANRYVPNDEDDSKRAPDADAQCSFVFAHCTSTHKEQWEPTIAHLFHLANDRVCEAWAVDCQSHGASASLNSGLLSAENPVGIDEYAALLHWFVANGPIRGERCVAVGHSSSTSACSIPLKALVLIEPVLISFSDHQDLIELGKARVKAVAARRDTWADGDELAAWMRKRHPWKTWDARVFDIYLRHGFKRVHVAGRTLLTPKCSTTQESRLYTHEPHVRAGHALHKICAQIPVHTVFAESAEFVSPKARSSTCDASAGRIMASVSTIPRAGHLAVQEQPDATAEAIFNALFVKAKAHL